MTYDVTKILILTKFFSKMLLRQKKTTIYEKTKIS